MTDKLGVKDYRFIAVCVIICASSLLVGVRYFHSVFPEASIVFQVTRDSSLPVAERFLSSQGLAVEGYRHASIFQYQEEAKVFLERELGLERANVVFDREIRLWRWAHRWYRPLQKEEMRLEVTTRGEIASFIHSIPEDAAGADLTAEEARGLAESFLVLEMGRDLDSLEYLDSQSQKRPSRTDHLFTWKVSGREYRQATFRISVTVQGDRVDGYSEFLKIPEEWSRGYARLRSLNETTSQVDLLFFVLIGIGMLVTLGRRLRLRDVKWKTALVLGLTALALQFLATLNSSPLTDFAFDTTGSYESFTARTLVSAILGSLALGGIILLLTACSEPLYREQYPSHISISRLLSWKSIRTRSFLTASLAGITLTFFFFAYEIGFYLTAKSLGAWAPAELPYTNLLNTRFPWIFVLLGGFFPAVSEEWMFRAFSIPYLQKLFRHRWLAILLASFVWGFGHANYPNQPFFIRGVEVGIVGIILSWAMLRFGILAPLIAHYSIDAFYSAFLFLRSGNPYLVTTGAITAGINLIPLAIAIGAYLVTRRFYEPSAVSNAAEGSALPPPTEEVRGESLRIPEYIRLSRKGFYLALGLALLGALSVRFQPPRFGDSLRFRSSPSEAETASVGFLSELGFDTTEYRRVTQPASRIELMAAQYIYEAAGLPGLNRIYGDSNPCLAWQTRFYKPLEKEGFQVVVHPSRGQAVSFHHSLPEEAAGADLNQEQARTIAAAFLEGRGYDLSQYDLKETNTEKPRQRRDTDFTWEAREGTPGSVGAAHLRVKAGVLGDKVGTWTTFVKIPEEWQRSRVRQNFYSISVLVIRTLFIASALALAVTILVRSTHSGTLRWKTTIRVAIAAMALETLDILNSSGEYLFAYDTRVALHVFILTEVVSAIILIIGIGLMAALAGGLILACFPDTPVALRGEARALWGRDAVLAAAAVLGGYLTLQAVVARIHHQAGSLALAPTVLLPANLETHMPILSSIRDAFIASLFYCALAALAVHVWTKVMAKTWQRLALAAGLLLSFLPGRARHFSEVAIDMIPSLLLLMFAFWAIKSLLRNNYIAYLFSAFALTLARAAFSLNGHGNLFLEVQAWLIALILAGSAVMLTTRKSTQGHSP